MAQSLSAADPGSLAKTIDGIRADLLSEMETKKLSPESTQVVLNLVNSVKDVAQQAGAGKPGDFDNTLANASASRAAGEIAALLATTRAELAARAEQSARNAENERELAEQAARAMYRIASNPDLWYEAIAESVDEARRVGGFLGAWVNTAKRTFPNVYVFGTDRQRGNGERETFVVVASRQPLDLAELGSRNGDPEFFLDGRLNEPRPFGESDMKALEIRSQGIVLTDDYAPVENLLAPVAATRGDD